jgi:hypothetical protein
LLQLHGFLGEIEADINSLIPGRVALQEHPVDEALLPAGV